MKSVKKKFLQFLFVSLPPCSSLFIPFLFIVMIPLNLPDIVAMVLFCILVIINDYSGTLLIKTQLSGVSDRYSLYFVLLKF